MKGYKVFDPDWKCRDKRYEVGKTYEEGVEPILCEQGMHFCTNLADCFSYYSFDPRNKVAVIEATGAITESKENCSKRATNELRVIEELSWEQVLRLCNLGTGNSGYGNSGDRNSGYGNSGNRNSGDRNSGNGNSGDWNSGDRNSGNGNSGNWNSGDWNSGNGNSGNWNSGDWNSGNWNSGDWNSGNRNSGDRNSGDWNSGNRNSGNWNSGDWNSGNWNSGNRNSGNGNSGDWNLGDRCSGVFNSEGPKKIRIFNKLSDWTHDDWLGSQARAIMRQAKVNEWVSWQAMSDKEKQKHSSAELAGGYLREYSYKDACIRMWKGLSEAQKEVIKALPNFDPLVFEEITGIKV